MDDKIKVLLSTEGTYPFHQGGVSVWCDILVNQLKDVDYVLYSVLMDPFVTQKFKLPSSAGLVKMPLWGTEEPSEHLTTPFSQVYMSKKRTTAAAIEQHFLPLFRTMLEEIVAVDKNHSRFAYTLLALYHYFQEYEYKATFKSELVWDSFKAYVLELSRDPRNKLTHPDVYSLIQSLGWIYRFFNILNTPVPRTHVTHASASAFCGIPCIIAKLDRGTPFMLTEHGVYLREQYLSLSKREYSSYLNTFLMRFILSVSGINYAFADQVSPVCQYNTRWETRFGVEPKRIHVIYNGVDKTVFTLPKAERAGPLTVVTVARIDPIKDILTLIRSAAIVKARLPEVKFVVYGSVSVPDYYQECLELRGQLGLTDSFIFAGHTSNMAAAYQSGDVIALSSISEAFPYSVVEAMMTGKPVITTDVGGIREALGDAGLLVAPRDADALAAGLVSLLEDAELRDSLGKDARERALSFFTLERVLALHLKSYIKLSVFAEEREVITQAAPVLALPVQDAWGDRLERQRNYMERGFALLAAGFDIEAVEQFLLALREASDSPAAPILLLETASVYNRLGEYDKAFQQLEKFEALKQLIELQQIA